jgi:hypothetical protein
VSKPRRNPVAAERKDATRVKTGRRRHHWHPTVDAAALPGTRVLFERRRPGRGYRHVLRKSDIQRFIGLLPDWDELAQGLEGIVLLPGDPEYQGMCFETWVGVFAWPRELWQLHDPRYLHDLRESMTRLRVPLERDGGGPVIAKWTEEAVRAYQLLDVLLHELGHHHDRMTTRRQKHVSRGESYAEKYAAQYADQIWDAYIAEFGLVVR